MSSALPENELLHAHSTASATSPQSEAPDLKQEDTTPSHGDSSHLQPDITDHDDDNEHDPEDSEELESVAHPEDDDHSDQDQDGQDDNEDHTDKRIPNSHHNGRLIETNGNGPDGDLSPLSSDNEEDGENTSVNPNDEEFSPEETVCRWKDCTKVLPSLAALVIHLSDEHIGWKKTSYTCEWQGCSRRPIAQTTRFALISHMRSHTKHKPYDCPVPECDKSFSRSDAMAKHLKCQHGDVPERFTGRKSRGRYTMKDPAASSTLLPSSSSGARKRRHNEASRSDVETSSLSSKLNPNKLRKLGNGEGDHRHFTRKFDSILLQQLDHSKRNGRHHNGINRDGDISNQDDDMDEEDDDAEDSDFAVDNGQSPQQRYGLLKAKFRYIYNERESLENEYEDLKKKLTRLRVERELLLDALLTSDQQYQDPALQDIEDSE